MATSIFKADTRTSISLAQTEPVPTSAAMLGSDVLRDLLVRSERDLLAARERVRRVTAEVSRSSRQVAHLERHAAALEAEGHRLRGQATPRDEELLELRERLSAANLDRDNALGFLSTSRAERASLRREIARLEPRAQSNTVALRALAEAQDGRATLSALLHEQAEATHAAEAAVQDLTIERDRLRQTLGEAQRELPALLESKGLRGVLLRYLARSTTGR